MLLHLINRETTKKKNNNEDNEENLQRVQKAKLDTWNRIQKHWDFFKSTPRKTEAGKKAFTGLEEAFNLWKNVHIKLDDYIAKTIENSGNKTEQDKYVNEYIKEIATLVKVSDNFSKLLVEQRERTFNFSKKMIDESAQSANNSIYTIIVVILIIAIAGLIFVFITISLITNSLNKIFLSSLVVEVVFSALYLDPSFAVLKCTE